MNSLPPEEKAMFEQLPPEQQEAYLREFMQQQI
jgi:hypothetical protein